MRIQTAMYENVACTENLRIYLEIKCQLGMEGYVISVDRICIISAWLLEAG